MQLTGRLFDISGVPQDVRVVNDADEVPVYLIGASGPVDTTATQAGQYQFAHVAPGAYRVENRVTASQVVESSPFTVGPAGAGSPDTLKIAFAGEMHCSPNPPEADGFGFEFVTSAPTHFEVQLLALDLDPIWTFADSAIGGFKHIHWAGIDDQLAHVPSGLYWAVVRVEGREAWNLVLWEFGTAPLSGGNCGHIDADGCVVSIQDTTLAWVWHFAETGSIHLSSTGERQGLHLSFLGPDSTRFSVADTCSENLVTGSIADTSLVSLALEPGSKWTFDLRGHSAGSTTLTLEAWHETHVHFTSPPIPIVVSP